MPIYVDSIELGIYFVILNLVATQLLFELGLGQAVLQVASHITETESSSFKALLSWLTFTYRKIAYKFLFFSIILGSFYLYIFTPTNYQYVIVLWVVIAIMISVNLAISFKYVLIEASGQVALAAKGRLLALFFSSVTTWILLYLNYGLIAVVAGYCIVTLVTKLWLQKYFLLNVHHPLTGGISYLHIDELKNIQHKFALSYLAGYISFNSVVPIVYALINPIDAGKVGLALALFSSVTVLSSSFITAKNPMLAKMIAEKDFYFLNIAFKKYLAMGVYLGIILIIFIYLGIMALDFWGFKFSDKLIDFKFLWVIALTALANSITYALAIYVRAHKVEPFVFLSGFIAIGTLVLVVWGAQSSPGWAVVGYSFFSIFVALPVTFIIFLNYYKSNCRKYLKC
jgi:O-antigen/teichoic acid export membrane protein